MNYAEEKVVILQHSKEQREKEILMYQINIDNYKLAIEEIKNNYQHMEEMQPFVEHLKSLLQSSIVEQTKEKIMLKVIESQLEK
jgi:UPF0288 family protein (methanogenesis marker protein 3)